MTVKRPLILIVEGAPEDIASYKRHLTRGSNRRRRIQEAATGAIALEFFRRRTPDCVLLDFRLPDMNGLEVLEAIADKSGMAPCAVVMLAEDGDMQFAVDAMKHGAHDVIEKGRITPALLERAISDAIEKSEMQREIEEHRRELAIKNLMLEQRLADLEREVDERGRGGEGHGVGERRFKRLLEALPGIVWMSDEKGYITYKNDRWTELTGLKIEEGLGDRWTAAVHPDDLPRILGAWNHSVTTGTAHEAPHRYRRRDGEFRWHLCRAVPLRNETGEVREWVGVSLDIHDRYVAERALIESETRYRALVEATTQLVWTADANGISDISWQWWSMITGVPEERLRGGRWIETVHPDDRQALHVVWGQSRSTQSPFEVEFRLRASDGEYRHFGVRGVPLFAGDHFNGWIGTLDDVTERRRAEDALKRANERFTVAEAAANGYVYDRDADTNRVERSAGFGAVLGYDENEIGASHGWWRTLIHPDDLHRVKETLDRAPLSRRANESDGYSLEYRLRHKDGRYLWVWDRSKLIRDVSGRVTRIVGSVVDITDRKQIENSLRESEEKFSKVFQASPHRIVIATLDEGLYIDANDAVLRDAGYQRSELIGHTGEELKIFAWPEGRAKLVQALQNGPVRDMEVPLRSKSGEVRTVLLSADIVTLNGRQCILAVSNDITARKRAEEALRESEEKFSKAFQASPHRISITTLDEGRYIDVNDAVLNSLGYERSEMIGRTAKELGVFAEWDGRKKLIEAIRNGTARNVELRMRSKSGEIRTVLWSAEIITLNGERCLLSISNDITERKRADEALRESEEKFSKVFKASPHRITISTLDDGRYIDVNDAVLSATGYKRSEMIGRTAEEVGSFPEDDRKKLLQALQDGPVRGVEYALRSKNGEVRTVLLSAEIITINGRRCVLTLSNDITERKKVEEALRESEERFRTLANTVPSIIWMAEADGTIIYHNQRWLDYCGVAPGDNNEWTREVIHPDDLERCLAEWDRAGALEREFEIELLLRRRDGEYRWFLVRATPTSRADDAGLRWFGVATDIHDRRRMEEALRESEERLNLAMEAGELFAWESDLVTGRVTWSDSGERMMGMAPGSFGGTYEAFLTLVHPDDLETVLSARHRALLGEEPYEVEYRKARPDGGVQWGVSRGVVHYDDHRRPTRFVGVNVDITKRKQMEEALRLSEERYRLLVRAASNVVIITNTGGGAQDSGAGWWEELTGQSWDEARNQGWMKCLHPDDKSAVAATFQKAVLAQEPFEAEFRVCTTMGDCRWLHATGAPIRDDRGEFREWAVALRDISERKRTEEKLRENEKFIQSLIDAVPLGIHIFDLREMRNVFFNHQLVSMLGYPADELKAMGSEIVPLIIHPEDQQSVYEHRESLSIAPDSAVLVNESRVKHGSGGWRWIATRDLVFKRGEDGNPLQILGVTQDVTDRKLAEAALERVNRRYLIALDAFDGYVYEYNVRDNISERSSGLAKLIGFESEEATPSLEWWIDLIHPDDRERFILEVGKKMAEAPDAIGETSYSMEYRMRHKEGHYVDVLDRFLVVRDEEGRPSQVVGAAINITERKRAEEELRESAEHLRMAMEAANAGSFDWDIASGVIVWTPHRVSSPEGAHSVEQDYQNWRARVHSEDIDWVEADIAKALADRRDLYIEYRVIRSDGSVQWVSNIGHTFYTESGEPVRMRGLKIDITDRKHTEELLRESEERLRLALEGAQAGVWEVRFNPYRSHWSKEYRELYAFSETDKATNELWATRVHPDDYQRVVDGNNRLLSSDRNELRQEFRIIHPERGERWILDFVRVRRDQNGRPVSFGGINLDVTDRKRVEIALRQSEERFRELVENISDVFWIRDPETMAPIYISPSYERLRGGAAASFEEWIDAIHPEDRERVRKKYLEKIMEGGYDETYRVVRPDGSVVWAHDRCFPVCDEAGNVRRIVGVTEDITDRKRFEDELRESQRRYAALAEAVPQLVWTAEPDGDMDYFNQRWYAYTGATPDGSLDQEWRSLIHPDDREHVEKIWRKGLRADEPVHFELRLRGVDGNYRWFIGRGVPYKEERRSASPRKQSGRNGANGVNGATPNSEKGRVVKWFGTFTDIHNLKLAEADVRESEERLRLAAQAAGFGLYSADLQTGHSYFSPEMRWIFGIMDNAPVMTDKLIEFVHPDDRNKVMRVAETSLDPGGDGEFEIEFRAPRPDGGVRWALAKGKTLFTGKGRRRSASRVIGVAFDITERREAEERLHASEELFRTIFDMSGIGIVQVDPSTGCLQRANRKFCDWLGYSEAELIEMKIEEIAHPDDRNEKWAAIRKCLRGEMGEYSIETRCVRRDGGVVWGLITSRMLCDAAGVPLRTVTTVQDITERKRFEEEIAASEERYRNLIERANEGIWLIDAEANTTYVNDRMASMLGCSVDEIMGRKSHEFFFKQDVAKAAEHVDSNLRGECEEFDFRFRRKDGGELLVLASTSPVFDAHGSIVGAMGMFTDITERKMAEEALRESERRLKLSLTAGRAGTWEWRIKEERMIWSDEYYDLYGIRPGEMEATLENFLFSVHLDDRDRMLIEMSEVLQERKDAEHEFRLIRPDGAVRWAQSSAQLMLDEMGEPERMVGIMIDITERKQAEMEREELLRKEREARAQAEAANRGKDEFVAMVSHELRSPLNAMLGWSKILKKGGVDAKTQTHAVEVIERSAKAQQNLIEDLLDMARIVGGKLRLETRPVVLARVVEAAADVVRPMATSREIDLELTIKSADEVTGDTDRLQQVIWNLLSNAVKFTTHGGKVEVILERVGASAQITVTDTGRGIKAEDLPFIFDRFRQGDSSGARRFSGLGLGLALVKHLVELHGGQVSAESRGEGQGASFIVRLPVRAVRGEATPARGVDRDSIRIDDARDGRMAPRESWDVYPIFPLEGIWAMIVDDEADARELVATLLKQYGARVTIASCAAEAFDKLRKGEAGARPDVLVSDISMPDEDGYMLIERVRKLPPEEGGRIPAIALTALEGPSDRIKALASGFSMHVPKPVEPEELAMVIANLTGYKKAPVR